MPTALITGISGQDGSYLAEQLLSKGWQVIGTTRDPSTVFSKADVPSAVELLAWDMRDLSSIASVLASKRPAAVYNLAARSSGALMFDSPLDMAEDNGLSVACLLEAIRVTTPETRFLQASSSEMFGAVEESPQDEATPFGPRSPYGAAKLYAHNLVGIYRRHFGLFACSAILYNHESPRRGDRFVTGKIARAAALIKLGLANELKLGNLDSRRDWGFAPDYVQAMHLMLEQPAADDYVIATGAVHSVRDFCDVAFRHVGLDYRDYVHEDRTIYRKTEEVPLRGDAGKAHQALGWRPRTSFQELVRLMVDAELKNYTETSDSRQRHEDDDR